MFDCTKNASSNSDRCLSERMVGQMYGCGDRRKTVSVRKITSNQQCGTPSIHKKQTVGLHSIMTISKEIWSYLISNQITITTEYLPEKLDVRPDLQPCHSKDSSEWMLKITAFLQIYNNLGHPEIHLFPSYLSHQLPQYYAWKPNPHSLAADALQQKWGEHLLFAFPPILPDSRNFKQNTEGKGYFSNSSQTSLELPSLVLRSPGSFHCASSTAS